MSDLTRIFVIVTTAKGKRAGSDSRLRLEFRSTEFKLGGQKHDEREFGRTDQYEFNFPLSVDIEDVRSDEFKLVAEGGDAWLPSSIFIIGKSRTNEFKVLVGLDNWPENAWLSTQTSDAGGRAEKARLLDRNATPTVS